MANIEQLRSAFVSAGTVKSKEVSDRDAVLDALAEEEDDEWTFDDEDFWNALDLMEETRKLLKAFKKRIKMSSMSKHLLEKHLDALGEFLDQFPPPPIDAEVEP